MNRQELEDKIDELVREYYENQEPEILEQILEMARQVRKFHHRRPTPTRHAKRATRRNILSPSKSKGRDIPAFTLSVPVSLQ
jgi:predicted house-cleaning noncanonical NTP pyrophosphatase (MazG superfamily)